MYQNFIPFHFLVGIFFFLFTNHICLLEEHEAFGCLVTETKKYNLGNCLGHLAKSVLIYIRELA